jgi:hypothetical protein
VWFEPEVSLVQLRYLDDSYDGFGFGPGYTYNTGIGFGAGLFGVRRTSPTTRLLFGADVGVYVRATLD